MIKITNKSTGVITKVKTQKEANKWIKGQIKNRVFDYNKYSWKKISEKDINPKNLFDIEKIK